MSKCSPQIITAWIGASVDSGRVFIEAVVSSYESDVYIHAISVVFACLSICFFVASNFSVQIKKYFTTFGKDGSD